MICVTLYGGPRHKEKYIVQERHAWLTIDDGHYAKVDGGKADEMFWHNFPPPLAYNLNGLLVLVRTNR